jgi:hypothetical protein
MLEPGSNTWLYHRRIIDVSGLDICRFNADVPPLAADTELDGKLLQQVSSNKYYLQQCEFHLVPYAVC